MTESNNIMIKILPLIIAQGQRLFNSNKNKRYIKYLSQYMVLTQKRKMYKRVRVVGYLDLVQRYLDDDFKSHFRMSRITIELLVNAVGASVIAAVQATTGRPQGSVSLQCLICIWVLANQESYRSIADRFNVSKSSVFKYSSRVCDALNKLAKDLVKWPEGQEVLNIIKGFKNKKSFPGVIGAIDGCHIEIKAPKENSATYVNRKGRSSVILQAVCDRNCVFTDCFVGFPDSVHDARVFQKSGMLEHCNNVNYFPNNSHLLGDSAYPLAEHILVPYKDNGHLTRKQIKFNVTHAGTRVTIERAFGILKERWRRLKYLELHCSDHIPSTIMAACVLQNFCIKHRDEISLDEDSYDNNYNSSPDAPNMLLSTRGGSDKRYEVTEILWRG